jgi:hypothetical protein
MVPPDMPIEPTDAIAAGLRFLTLSQQPNGSFLSDWYRVAGDEVVDVRPENSFFQTAFIGSVLMGVAGAQEIVRGVTRFADERREAGSVWRYLLTEHPGSPQMAPDVDDTALAAMLLREAGRPVREANAAILSNRDGKGRFYTWITVLGSGWRSPVRVRILIDRRSQLRDVVAGFKNDNQRVRDLDAGVNANVVLYLGRCRGTERAVDFLIDVATRGVIADRWYQDPFMLWYLISRALRRHEINAGAVLLQHLNSSRPTSPMQLAQATSIALDWGQAVPEEWISGLLRSQSTHGGWERIPVYSVKDERWGSEATTTALCVEALARWLGAPPPSRDPAYAGLVAVR